ncbi:MAG: hypothetical protein PHR61_05155 [Candidatus Absconditabacteria bacterium]|nr:hypothetical protein [Candidatus Absconditabacteria bacterium]
MQDTYLHELNFCLQLREKEGGCTFGGGTKCEQCAVTYLLWKLLTGEIIHGEIKRLTLKDWKEKTKTFNS